MERITVNLEKNSYPIIISSKSLNNLSFSLPMKKGDRVMLITNNKIALLHLNTLYNFLTKLNILVDKLILPDGERYKSIATLDKIITSLLKNCHDRKTTLIAFGGGVIGDLTGFAAAIYQRGIRFIQIPTTLLSQVDASIGGKTAVNHLLGKNMIGSFYQPSTVIINTNYLSTLSYRELISGIAEVIKYGIAFDKNFFIWIESNIDDLLKLKSKKIMFCIRRCCEIKSNIVSFDERDLGIRTLLNLGHTYGHAIETYLGYDGTWLHGEAVSAGIMMAIHTAKHLGQFQVSEIKRVRKLMLHIGLPITGPPEMSSNDYLSYMINDKKNIYNHLSLIVPKGLGKAELRSDISEKIIHLSIEDSYNQ